MQSSGLGTIGRLPGPGSRPEWRLTARETEVLAIMAAGKTNSAIAEALYISRKAVEKHVNSIFTKLLLNSDDARHPRVHAVLIYLMYFGPARPDAAETLPDTSLRWRRDLTSPRGASGRAPRSRARCGRRPAAHVSLAPPSR